MSPGINDHPYNTGTLPKSNRRSDRNRQIDNTVNNRESNWIANDRQHSGVLISRPPQHANNLSQVDWHPVYQFPPHPCSRSGKNSNNTKLTYAPPSSTSSCAGSLDLRDLGYCSSHNRYPNLYSQPENIIPWLKMTSSHHPPPNFAEKPTNTDKMPERHQVEGRLNQIRECIKVTTSMMESLSQSTDPQAQAKHANLSEMVEGLYDSKQKLTKLLEESEKYWGPNENGEFFNDETREQELRKKIDESQRKLAQLQDQQAHLVGMQMQVRERLNEARQAQQALLATESGEHEEDDVIPEEGNSMANGHVIHCKVDQLERETESLRCKLQQLENKKSQMDHLMHELQAADLGCCSSEGQQRDRASELEAMKAQLQQIKTLMHETTHVQNAGDAQASELDHEENGAAAVVNEEIYPIEENGYIISEDRSKPTVEQIQAVTRELKEQQHLLQTAKAELIKLKQHSTVVNPSSPIEKKLRNNNARSTQNNQRQFDELNRKESYQSSLVNQNGSSDWSNRTECNSVPNSQTSTTNQWSQSTNIMNTPHEHNVDTMSAQETLLEMGSQPLLDHGNNFWNMPPLITNQLPQGAPAGTAEYYRQLLLGSQAQQLQILTTTLQQCCQLLWAQQREMQSMRTAINQLQSQFRHSQSRTSNNLEPHEEHHSNLVRPATQQHFSSLDTITLPPSSSLPNLVSLPGGSSVPPPPVSTISNCQQQQQQLNNQVPPGNRANNYWDNFRSYSRQNLLSGTSKTVTDGAMAHATTSAVTHPHMNNKRNRQQPLEIFPPLPPEVHYSLKLQPQQDRESTSSAPRNNFVPTNEPQLQQPENVGAEASGPLRSEQKTDDESYTKIATKISEREDLRLILMHCLKVLENGKQNVSPLPSSNISNNSDSSDDESEAVAMGNDHNQNQIPVAKCTDMSLTASSGAQDPFLCGNDVSLPSMSSSIQTIDLAESNQINIEPLNNHTLSSDSICAEHYTACIIDPPQIGLDISSVSFDELNAEDERERAEYVMLDRGSHAPAGGVMDHVQK